MYRRITTATTPARHSFTVYRTKRTLHTRGIKSMSVCTITLSSSEVLRIVKTTPGVGIIYRGTTATVTQEKSNSLSILLTLP